MNAVEKLQKRIEIGQPIFEQFFALSDIDLKAKIRAVCMDGESILGVVDSNCVITRTITNEVPSEIMLSFYDSIKLDWQGIHYMPDHYGGTIVVNFNEFFNPKL